MIALALLDICTEFRVSLSYTHAETGLDIPKGALEFRRITRLSSSRSDDAKPYDNNANTKTARFIHSSTFEWTGWTG